MVLPFCENNCFRASLTANIRPKNFCFGLIRPKVNFNECLGIFLSFVLFRFVSQTTVRLWLKFLYRIPDFLFPIPDSRF